MLMALCLAVIMGFAALGFDLAYVRLARLQMQNASDAAAHAAIVNLRVLGNNSVTSARNAAVAVAAANTVLGKPVQLGAADVVFGQWDFDQDTFAATAPANAVSVSGRRSDTTAADGFVSLTFGRVLGFTQSSVARTSVGAFRPRATMFEQDTTGSFLTSSCALDQAIAADLEFLKAMNAVGIPADRIGMDVFTGGAKNFTALKPLSANYLQLKNDWRGDGNKSNLVIHKTGLGACNRAPASTTADYIPCPVGPADKWPNQANLSPTVSNISCSLGDFNYTKLGVHGGTNIGAGIKSGIDTLKASAKPHEAPSIVVLTDGGPMCCEDPGGGHTCGKIDAATGKYNKPCCADAFFNPCIDNVGNKACQCASDVAAYGIAQANEASKAGIDVYVLAFGSNPDWVAYAKSLARGRGFGLDTSDPAQLQAMLLQFANNIPIALVK